MIVRARTPIGAHGMIRRRPLNLAMRSRGVGDAMSDAVAYFGGGQAVGSPQYMQNLNAAKRQPGFNQAQFDAWYQCESQGTTGFKECTPPSFVAYEGSTAPSNVVFDLTQSGQAIPAAYAAAVGAQPPAQSNAPDQSKVPPTTKKTATPKRGGVVTLPAPGTAVQSNAPNATTVSPTVAPSANWFDGVPNWLLLAGAAGVGALFFFGSKS